MQSHDFSVFANLVPREEEGSAPKRNWRLSHMPEKADRPTSGLYMGVRTDERVVFLGDVFKFV